MKQIKQQCNQCSVISRWVYKVRLPNVTKYPLLLCDDCLIDQFHNSKDKDKKMEINNDNDN
jgi:hypothetical protein